MAKPEAAVQKDSVEAWHEKDQMIKVTEGGGFMWTLQLQAKVRAWRSATVTVTQRQRRVSLQVPPPAPLSRRRQRHVTLIGAPPSPGRACS